MGRVDGDAPVGDSLALQRDPVPTRRLSRKFGLALCTLLISVGAGADGSRGDGGRHSLFELHGKHNTVYLLGSIHVLRPKDYPLAPAVLEAYGSAKRVLMEVNPDELTSAEVQAEMLAGAILADGRTLEDVLGAGRYARAATLAHEAGVDLSMFDQFAPWFAAEALSQVQLSQLNFAPESGVEMYFMGRARSDGKSVAGLETAHDQLSIFEGMPMDTQAAYLMSSLEQAHDLARDVDSMVDAWEHGDMPWFEREMQKEFGRDPRLFQTMLGARNRKWVPQIEALLNDDVNYLVIVGTGHLVGPGSIIELLKKDGIGATQQ